MNLSNCERCGIIFRPPFQKEKERFCDKCKEEQMKIIIAANKGLFLSTMAIIMYAKATGLTHIEVMEKLKTFF